VTGIRQFDEKDVLNQATNVFWQRGYERTAIQDLVEATGVGRGSLYNAFGDKEQLFLAVLDYYQETVVLSLTAFLSDPNPYCALERLLNAIVERMSDPTYPPGCLYTNTLIECSARDEVIRRKSTAVLGSLESAIYQVLHRAQIEGMLDPRQDIRALARFFVGITQALAVLSKAFADPSVLKNVVKVAMSVWDTSSIVND